MKANRVVCCGIVAIVGIACAGPEPARSMAASADAVPAAASTAPPPESAAPAPAPAPEPSPQSTSKAIATTEGETPGLKVEITELKRTSGGTLTLRFTMINESDKMFNFSDLAMPEDLTGSGHAIGSIHLLDPVGKKKYFVARDGEGNCVCSSRLVNLARGARINLWAKYAAPPDDVERISIVIPKFLPLEDVPVSR